MFYLLVGITRLRLKAIEGVEMLHGVSLIVPLWLVGATRPLSRVRAWCKWTKEIQCTSLTVLSSSRKTASDYTDNKSLRSTLLTANRSVLHQNVPVFGHKGDILQILITQKLKELAQQNVLGTDRKHVFLNRLEKIIILGAVVFEMQEMWVFARSEIFNSPSKV